jgi:hypothetical protein
VGTLLNPIDTSVVNVAGRASLSGDIGISNTGALTIATVDGLVGLGATAGGISLISDSLIINNDVLASTDVTLTARDSAVVGDDLTIVAGVTVQSTTGNITLNAGDNFRIDNGGRVSADGAVNINLDVNGIDPDPGVGTDSTLQGLLNSGTGITFQSGSDADTFTIAESLTANIASGAGDDGFTFGTGGSLGTGTIDGGTGTNTLTGGTTANTFTITGLNSGTATGTGGFSNIQNLAGNINADSFILSAGGTLAGTIVGGNGTDTLTGDNGANTFNITGSNSGSVTGVTGGFSAIENLTGGTSTDNFTLSDGGTLEGTIVGGDGSDTFTAASDVANTFTITGINSGTATGIAGFSNIENLVGGSQDDRFIFLNGSLSGNIFGNSGAFILEGDTLNFSSLLSGSGILQIQPQTLNRAIRLGGSKSSSPTQLELSSAEIANISGFSQITIGLSNGSGLISAIGDLTFSSPVTLQSLGSGGAIDLSSGTLTTRGTSLTLLADQTLTTASLLTNGGALTIASTSGNIDTTGGVLQTSGGVIRLSAPGTITTADLDSSADTGGDITLISSTALTTGGITSRGLGGDGGNVTLDPPGDVEVSYIDATGGTEGFGGNISVTTQSLFRATALIPNSTESISSAGGLGGGAITIYHNGVQANEFFTVAVGESPVNGTLGGITSGQLQVRSGYYGQTLAVTRLGEFVEPTGVDDRPNINLIVDGVLPIITAVEEGNGCPLDCQSDIPPNLPTLGDLSLDPFLTVIEIPVEQIDAERTAEVASYNEIDTNDRPKPPSLSQVQSNLQSVEDATGIKPAIIYALFNPSTVTTADRIQEKGGTKELTPSPDIFWEFPPTDLDPSNVFAQTPLPGAIKREALPTDELELVLVTAEGNPIRVRVVDRG